MRTRRLLISGGAALLAAAAFALAGPGGQTKPAALSIPRALAGDPSAARGARVAILATLPGASHTSLYVVESAETGKLLAPVSTLSHAEDAAVRGAMVPGTDVVAAVADTKQTRDLSFAGSLFRLAPHRAPELLCDRVVHASRPLVTRDRRVFVSRGVAGKERDGQYRADDLTIDEVDLATGAARTVHAFQGYLAFLAGAHEREILVYRVDAKGADLAGVDPDTGAVRVIAKLLPFARDFSVDAAGGLIFQERDEHDARAWTIDRVDIATGARSRLHTGPSASLAPFAWPGGGVAWSRDGGGGLAMLRGGKPLGAAPLGPGVDLIRAVSSDGAWVAALHTLPGRLAVPFVIDTRTGAAGAVAAPPGARIEIAGIVETKGGTP